MKIEYNSSTAREAFRTAPPGLTAVLGTGERYTVHDLSAGGLSLVTSGNQPRAGARITMDLYLANRLFLKGVSADLVRMLAETAAYAFVNLTRVQEQRLDKLVLTMQKQEIARGGS
jgi:c-di-GMP-binding flagellar brake protein YcgR